MLTYKVKKINLYLTGATNISVIHGYLTADALLIRDMKRYPNQSVITWTSCMSKTMLMSVSDEPNFSLASQFWPQLAYVLWGFHRKLHYIRLTSDITQALAVHVSSPTLRRLWILK